MPPRSNRVQEEMYQPPVKVSGSGGSWNVFIRNKLKNKSENGQMLAEQESLKTNILLTPNASSTLPKCTCFCFFFPPWALSSFFCPVCLSQSRQQLHNLQSWPYLASFSIDERVGCAILSPRFSRFFNAYTGLQGLMSPPATSTHAPSS